MWLTAAVCAACFVYMFFFFEEASLLAMLLSSTNVLPKTCFNRRLDQAHISNAIAAVEGITDKGSDRDEKAIDDHTAVYAAADRQLLGKPYNLIQKMRMFTGTYCSWRQMFDSMWRPFWIIVRFPAVLFAGFEYGVSLTSYSVMVSTVGVVINVAPYNFTSGPTGLLYFAPFLVTLRRQIWVKIA
jgi:hypothetical protein